MSDGGGVVVCDVDVGHAGQYESRDCLTRSLDNAYPSSPGASSPRKILVSQSEHSMTVVSPRSRVASDDAEGGEGAIQYH